MSQQKYAYRINSLKLKQGTPVKTGKINVFVGANNCGKTQVLKDMLSYITGSANSHVVLEELAITFPETWNAMKESYCIPVYDTNSGQQLRHISPTLDAKRLEFTTTNLEDNLEKWLINNKLQFRKLTGASFVTFLNTDNRLKLAAAQPVQNLEKNGVKNVLEALYLAGAEPTFKVRENAKAIFNTDLYVDTSNLGTIQYKVGKDFSGISENTQKSHSELSPYPLLDTQGDGLRSAVGIISALTAVKKPIILMDEPEAFLHPPQALLLGEMISNLIDDSQQIFIATHSADFVRGLLSTTRDAVIIHLDRISDTETIAHPLDSVTLNKIITNPLLSSSRVLEGMFYKGVVATEADADTVFYQRLFQRVNASDEIHFVNAHISEDVMDEISNNISNSEISFFSKQTAIDISKLSSADTEEEPQAAKTIKKEIKPHIAKWRSAEQQCIDIEKYFGNTATDVSKQNVGYDIESTTPDGCKRYIEVKSITEDGSFSITNNEYTAAHQYGEQYYLCLLIQSAQNTQAIYIQNPLETLKFEKRIRQWEWYCDSYSGESFIFES